MKQPRIIHKLIRDKNKIVEMVIKDTVKAIGDSGFVSFPKELVGKYVEIKIKLLNGGDNNEMDKELLE